MIHFVNKCEIKHNLSWRGSLEVQQSQTIYLMGTVIDVFVDHEEPEKF